MALRRLLLPVLCALLAMLAVPSAIAGPGDQYVGPRFGDGFLPAGCIVDRDPLNPDNRCYHMKVGLNALDSPHVDVDVMVPVSPAAERDTRIASQSVQMWDDGLHYLAEQMELGWLARGFEMTVRTHEVPVDENGMPKDPIDLIDPEIVVIVSNPVGGIGIGIDPTAFGGELGLYDDEGVPCAPIENPFSMTAWQARDGFEQHSGEPGGVYVEDCGGVGGNVCFAVNGAVDPVPGASDFFGLYDLVSHEFGHCLTVGHVGDGADGPWGPTPTNDIMAYSTDPPLLAKCVSTLDVEGFALRMSRYLDVNGDGTVDDDDLLVPNDAIGDGSSSFQVQHPADHHYASSTGLPGDCPQPDQSIVPLAEGDFMPKAKVTTEPVVELRDIDTEGGRLRVRGEAVRSPLTPEPRATRATAKDADGDSYSPVTDLRSIKVDVTAKAVKAVLSVGQVYPLVGASPVAYSLTIDGRRLDSFIANGDATGTPVVMDNGTGYYLPAGTARWDATAGTVTFSVPRHYLADQGIEAPYNVYGVTGYHARSNDWIGNDDLVPDDRDLDVAGPRLARDTRDAPVADRVTRSSQEAATGSFVPSDSTLGVGLISAVDNRDYLTVPVPEQASVLATLTWTGDASMGLVVAGGNAQKLVKDNVDNTVQVLVPWARRDLTVTVDPQEVFTPVDYTLTVEQTTVVADKDHDDVPDVADDCPTAKGPSVGGGCPDTDRDGVFDRLDDCVRVPGTGATGCPVAGDEMVVAMIDGRRVDSQRVMTRHDSYGFDLAADLPRGRHTLTLLWLEGSKTIARVTRTIG